MAASAAAFAFALASFSDRLIRFFFFFTLFVDADGDTPLHHCETAAFAAVLVGRGADHLRRNGEGKTPLEVKVEEAIAETDQDYDDEDEEQINSKEIIGYLMTLPGYEREGGERSAKRAR